MWSQERWLKSWFSLVLTSSKWALDQVTSSVISRQSFRWCSNSIHCFHTYFHMCRFCVHHSQEDRRGLSSAECCHWVRWCCTWPGWTHHICETLVFEGKVLSIERIVTVPPCYLHAFCEKNLWSCIRGAHVFFVSVGWGMYLPRWRLQGIWWVLGCVVIWCFYSHLTPIGYWDINLHNIKFILSHFQMWY